MNRDLWLLFGLAMIVRGLAAWPQQQPHYMDAAYYYVNGVNLVEGRGFVEDFVWNYLGDPAPPPHPSHLYWMPLTSILAAGGMLLTGPDYRGAQIPFVLLSAALAPVSYWAAIRLGGRRWQGWLAGLLAIFSGFYMPFWTAIDNFTPFGLAGALAILLTGVGAERSKPREQGLLLLLAGLCAGLAHLARADGPLLLGSMGLLLLLRGWRGGQLPRGLGGGAVLMAGYLLVMGPWFVRNWLVVGTPLPVAGSQTIWLHSYDDLFSYGRELSWQTFAAQGIEPILAGRWWALTVNLQTVLAVWGMIFVGPLAVVGLWATRRQLLSQLASLYGVLLFAVMTVVFAYPGARGGLFHSGAAVLPFIYAAGAIGLAVSVDWLAQRRRRWRPALGKQVFSAGMVLMALFLSGFIYYQQVLRNDAWNRTDSLYPAVAAWVAQQEAGAVVMIGNPPAYRYHGGGLSVIVPNASPEMMLEAARQYGVDYVILDRNHPAPLAGLYAGTETLPALSPVQTFGDEAILVFEVEP